MKDDWKVGTKETQKLKDFQPLCKTANDAKRSHCKQYKETHKRYDAKQLGYSYSFTRVDENSPVCDGCYWNDPYEFNQEISENFIKKS